MGNERKTLSGNDLQHGNSSAWSTAVKLPQDLKLMCFLSFRCHVSEQRKTTEEEELKKVTQPDTG